MRRNSACENGRIRFDYKLREGVVSKSNLAAPDAVDWAGRVITSSIDFFEVALGRIEDFGSSTGKPRIYPLHRLFALAAVDDFVTFGTSTFSTDQQCSTSRLQSTQYKSLEIITFE